MRTFIQIKKWAGRDTDQATAVLAKIFRLPRQNAEILVRRTACGDIWCFDKPVPFSQANRAIDLLRAAGFQAIITSRAPAPPAPPAAVPDAPVPDEPVPPPAATPLFAFHGDGLELAKIRLVNLLLILATLGVYQFWAKTRVRQYLLAATTFAGDSFNYHGNGMELCRGYGRLIGILIVAFLGNVYVFYEFGMTAGNIAANVFGMALTVAAPVIMVSAWRFRLARTSWRGIRFFFDGSSWQAVKLYVKSWLWMTLSLGMYMPYFVVATQTFWRSHSRFGDMPFEYSGRGTDLFMKYLKFSLLVLPTLGLYTFWFMADVRRYHWSHTRFAGGTFRFTATGKELCFLKLVNGLLLIATLGLAIPWVTVRNQRFQVEHLFLDGARGIDQAVQRMQTTGALGDEAVDLLDIPIELP